MVKPYEFEIWRMKTSQLTKCLATEFYDYCGSSAVRHGPIKEMGHVPIHGNGLRGLEAYENEPEKVSLKVVLYEETLKLFPTDTHLPLFWTSIPVLKPHQRTNRCGQLMRE